MKRNNELIKKLLLNLEEVSWWKVRYNDDVFDSYPKIEGYNCIDIHYHIRLLLNAGFISEDKIDIASTTASGTINRPSAIEYQLTWLGHNYIDEIRDK